jgi:hypothetical protein
VTEQRQQEEQLETAREYCEKVRAAHPSKFARFIAGPNVSCVHRAMPPRGGVALFHAGPMCPDMLDGNLHCGTALYRVLNPTEAPLGAPKEELYDMAAQLSQREGPTLDLSTTNGLEDDPNKHWEATFDRAGSFAGLYRTTLRAPGYPPSQVLIVAVRAGAGRAGEELYDMAETMAAEGRTWANFVEHPRYRFAENLARRNRNRLALEFAQRLGLHLKSLPDFCAAASEAETELEYDVEAALEGSQVRNLTEAGYLRMAAAVLRTDVDAQLDIAAELGVEVTPDLLDAMDADPECDGAGRAFLDVSGEAARRGGARRPAVAAPFSETVENSIVLSGSTVAVYSNAVPLFKLGRGHGVAQCLSPVEGINMLHGRDADPQAEAPFGSALQGGPLRFAPTSTGRLQATAQVDWDFMTVANACEDSAPFNLLWDGRGLPGAEGGVNDKVLYGDRSVYRARDGEFVRQEVRLGQVDERGVSLGSTRLDPVFVLCASTPTRRFFRGVPPELQ